MKDANTVVKNILGLLSKEDNDTTEKHMATCKSFNFLVVESAKALWFGSLLEGHLPLLIKAISQLKTMPEYRMSEYSVVFTILDEYFELRPEKEGYVVIHINNEEDASKTACQAAINFLAQQEIILEVKHSILFAQRDKTYADSILIETLVQRLVGNTGHPPTEPIERVILESIDEERAKTLYLAYEAIEKRVKKPEDYSLLEDCRLYILAKHDLVTFSPTHIEIPIAYPVAPIITSIRQKASEEKPFMSTETETSCSAQISPSNQL